MDNRDLQVVKVCGKSVPDVVEKKHQPVDIRPMFVATGNWWMGTGSSLCWWTIR